MTELTIDLTRALIRVEQELSLWTRVIARGRKRIYAVTMAPSIKMPAFFRNISEAKTRYNIIERLSISAVAFATLDTNSDGLNASDLAAIQKIRDTWWTAFEPLLIEAQLPGHDFDFIDASILRIRFLFSSLHLQYFGVNPGKTDENVFKITSRKMREGLGICRALVCHPYFPKAFVLSSVGMIPVLFLVVMRYPFSELAQEALSILREMRPRREGFWFVPLLLNIPSPVPCLSPSR